MEITLEKIELVKDRTGVTYAEAKQALEEADGSVVDAIIAIEENINSTVKKGGNFGNKTEAIVDSIKEQVSKGNASRIQVKRDGELIVNLPVNAGIVGLVIAPIASVIATIAAFGFKCTIEIVKDDGTIIDISDAVTDAIGTVTEKGSAAMDVAFDKSAEIYAKGKEKASDKAEEIKSKFADEEEAVVDEEVEAEAEETEETEETSEE